MPLELKISPYSLLAQKPPVLLFTDDTGEHSDTNPGGYGGPNPARHELALFLQAEYYRIAGPEPLEVPGYPKVLAPESPPQQFLVNLPEDGWVSLTLVAFPAAAGWVADNLAPDAVVYDTNLLTLQQLKEGQLVAVEDFTRLDIIIQAVQATTRQEFAVPNHAAYLNELRAQSLLLDYDPEEDKKGCETSDKARRLMRRIQWLEIKLAATVYEFCFRKAYFVAQGNIEKMNPALI